MKFDDLLAQYLYQNKSLELQGIGTFTLDEKVSIPGENEKEIYYPIEGLSFHFNPKVDTREDLIVFLVKKLGKIQPLVRSDLDSFLSNIKQFLNLGKPYTIEGIGTLHKSNNGIYEFTPGNFLPVKEELNPKRENPDHNYPANDGNRSARIFMVVLIVLASLAALGGVGWAVYHFLIKQPVATEPVAEQTADTSNAVNNITPIDSSALLTTIDSVPALPDTGFGYYKMIFEITPSRERATSRTADLNSMHRVPSKFDSINTASDKQYRLYLLMKLNANDTTGKKDSLSRFFNRKIIVERQ